MNTTPIQFGHITINGQTYPVKFGLAQSRDYCKALGCELKDFNGLFQLDKEGKNKFANLETNGDEMIVLVWSALKQGARVEGSDFHMSQDDVADLIDYMNQKPALWAEFFNVMNDGLEKEAEPASPNGKKTKLVAA